MNNTKYEITPNSLVVKPIGEPIYSERATFVSIDDEAAGPFVSIEQHTDELSGKIKIDVEEWSHIRKAIDQMVEICKKMEKS